MFSDIYRSKTVLITGDSGFKGSWLVSWLERLGAKIYGISLDPPSYPSHSELLDLEYTKHRCDLCDTENVTDIVKKVRPDIIFHLAAQSLVRESYQYPYQTLHTNIMGTASLLEAVRNCSSVKAVVVATSDKCYQNTESGAPFVEDDPLGGYDPYSASKGAAEIVAQSYRASFLAGQGVLLATVRAGNVIGGGDWGAERLFPDLMEAASKNKVVAIRSPQAIRPWQHVLEPLSGYLLVGEKLLRGEHGVATAWNFGPKAEDHFCVEDLIKQAQESWQNIKYSLETSTLYEAKVLKLSCKKAERILRWEPTWSGCEAVKKSVEWYRSYYLNSKILTSYQIDRFILDAQKQGVCWIN